MKCLRMRLVGEYLSILYLKVSLVEAKKLTVVFRVFDWDHYKESDKIGEVLKMSKN